MRKLLLCVTLLLLTNAHAAGQTSAGTTLSPFTSVSNTGNEAARLLKSQGNRERAWGAFLAGAHGLKGQTSLVVELLEDVNVVAGGGEEALVRQAALDALIRLNAEVPAEKLLPLYASSPDEVVILLARAPKQNEQALLSLFVEEIPDVRWAAVGNLLAESRPNGFAARLLSGLKVEANVYVYDGEGDYGHSGGCGGGSGGGCSHFRMSDELPPVGYYTLGMDALRGAVVFAPGRHTVYYLRSLTQGPCGDGFYGGYVERDERRVEYLADMLETTTEELGLEAHSFHEVVCKEAQQCRRALAEVRDKIVGGYAEALKRLLAAGLLDPAEAAELKPDITLQLNDSRGRRLFSLPDKLKGVKVELYVNEAEPPAESDETPPAESEESEETPPAESEPDDEAVACTAKLPCPELTPPPVP
jgi:hypothetical protein